MLKSKALVSSGAAYSVFNGKAISSENYLIDLLFTTDHILSANTGLLSVWQALFRHKTFSHQIGDRGSKVPAITATIREITADHVLGGEAHIDGPIRMDAESVLKNCSRGEGPATTTTTLISNAVDACGPLRPGVE